MKRKNLWSAADGRTESLISSLRHHPCHDHIPFGCRHIPAGVILDSALSKARPMQIWEGGTPKNYAAEPHVLIEELKKGEAIKEADILFANHPKPIKCCLQCACNGSNSDYCRSSSRLALNLRRRYFHDCGWQSEMKRRASSVVGRGPQTATMRFHDGTADR
jgi:hypothetical protein